MRHVKHPVSYSFGKIFRIILSLYSPLSTFSLTLSSSALISRKIQENLMNKRDT